MSHPKISIVLPTFNHASYLSDAINSVLNQSYTNFELLILDDASTDATQTIIRSFQDVRIRSYRNETNLGANASWNMAMAKAEGEYCCQLDADDTLPANSLELRINAIGKKQALFSSLTRIEGNRSTLVLQHPLNDPKVIANFLRGRQKDFDINIASLLFKRSVFSTIGYRTITYSSHADDEFCLKILLQYSVNTLEISTYKYIQRENSLCHRAFKDEHEIQLFHRLCEDYAAAFSAKSAAARSMG